MIAVALIIVAVVSIGASRSGNDAYAYWLAWRGDRLYTAGPMTGGAYLYSPAFAQAIWPLTQLPWPAFAVVVTVVNSAGLAWLLSPLGLRWAIPLWIAGLPEITTGNIFIPLAVTAAIGLRWPAAWAFAALTKVTLCVGPVWFLARREWRSLGVAIGATAAVVALSTALRPELWTQWVHLLWSHSGGAAEALGSRFAPPLALRLPVGIAVVAWGALTDRRWTVPVAMVLCSPVVWYGTLTLLAAIPRISRSRVASSERSE
jgi:hypothetical protein